jgi:hypothetical protein
MKSTLLLGLLASTSFASARILPGTHLLAVGASLISGPLPALAKPVWRHTLPNLGPRQANSTTSFAMSGSSISAASLTTSTAIVSAIPSNSTAAAPYPVGNATLPSGTNVTSISDPDSGVSSGTSDTDIEGTQANTTSSCGGHHHHQHNSTGTTDSTTHRKNNGTSDAEHHVHNSTSLAAGSGQCNGTSHHHHHNGTSTGTAIGGPSETAASFFIPATATASVLAVPLTSSAATG